MYIYIHMYIYKYIVRGRMKYAHCVCVRALEHICRQELLYTKI